MTFRCWWRYRLWFGFGKGFWLGRTWLWFRCCRLLDTLRIGVNLCDFVVHSLFHVGERCCQFRDGCCGTFAGGGGGDGVITMQAIEYDKHVPFVVFIFRGCNDEKQLITCISSWAVGRKGEREKRKIEFETQLKMTRLCGVYLFLALF